MTHPDVVRAELHGVPDGDGEERSYYVAGRVSFCLRVEAPDEDQAKERAGELLAAIAKAHRAAALALDDPEVEHVEHDE